MAHSENGLKPDRRAIRRFFSNVEVSKSGCWDWCGCRNGSGYGGFRWSRHTLAHRVAYLWFVGPIESGAVIDHLCRLRSCVNPAHMEEVSCSVNNSRGVLARARQLQAQVRLREVFEIEDVG